MDTALPLGFNTTLFLLILGGKANWGNIYFQVVLTRFWGIIAFA